MDRRRRMVIIIIGIILVATVYIIINININKKGAEKGLSNEEIINTNEREVSGNIFFIKGIEDFTRGTLNNLEIAAEIKESGDQCIKLLSTNNEYGNKGVFISEIFNTEKFNKLIVSWNAETPENTYIEVEAKVYIENDDNSYDGKWSEWMSWGKWGTEIERKCSNTNSEEVKINVDTFQVKDNKYASKIQLKATLFSDNSKNTPLLKQLSATFINDKEREMVVNSNNSSAINKVIETPCISQRLREKSIASVICSPTSMTMLLNRLGEELVVEDVAWKCFDYEYDGFGNWVYNVAYAGSRGYESYIEFGSLESLKREILNGYPVAVSVKYTNKEEDKEHPYIEGSPITTNGHLIVACGIECDSKGQEYVIVNDPAGVNNEEVRRKYKLNEFMKAWETSNNVMYIVH